MEMASLADNNRYGTEYTVEYYTNTSKDSKHTVRGLWLMCLAHSFYKVLSPIVYEVQNVASVKI